MIEGITRMIGRRRQMTWSALQTQGTAVTPKPSDFENEQQVIGLLARANQRWRRSQVQTRTMSDSETEKRKGQLTELWAKFQKQVCGDGLESAYPTDLNKLRANETLSRYAYLFTTLQHC